MSSSGELDSHKRTKIDTKERESRISDIQEQISDLDKRIVYKHRRIETASVSRNFKVYDELAEEVSELKSQRRELTCELGPLQKKSKKSSWYKKKTVSQPASTANSTDSSEPAKVNEAINLMTEDEPPATDDKESGMNEDTVSLNA